MLESLRQRFAESVHHGDGSLHPFVVGELHDLEPTIGAGFSWAQRCHARVGRESPHRRRELNRARPSQLTYHFNCVHPEQFGEEIDLARTEAVDMDRWLRLMYCIKSRYHSNGMYGLCPP